MNWIQLVLGIGFCLFSMVLSWVWIISIVDHVVGLEKMDLLCGEQSVLSRIMMWYVRPYITEHKRLFTVCEAIYYINMVLLIVVFSIPAFYYVLGRNLQAFQSFCTALAGMMAFVSLFPVLFIDILWDVNKDATTEALRSVEECKRDYAQEKVEWENISGNLQIQQQKKQQQLLHLAFSVKCMLNSIVYSTRKQRAYDKYYSMQYEMDYVYHQLQEIEIWFQELNMPEQIEIFGDYWVFLLRWKYCFEQNKTSFFETDNHMRLEYLKKMKKEVIQLEYNIKIAYKKCYTVYYHSQLSIHNLEEALKVLTESIEKIKECAECIPDRKTLKWLSKMSEDIKQFTLLQAERRQLLDIRH